MLTNASPDSSADVPPPDADVSYRDMRTFTHLLVFWIGLLLGVLEPTSQWTTWTLTGLGVVLLMWGTTTIPATRRRPTDRVS